MLTRECTHYCIHTHRIFANKEIAAFPNLHTEVIYVNAEIHAFTLGQIFANVEIYAFRISILRTYLWMQIYLNSQRRNICECRNYCIHKYDWSIEIQECKNFCIHKYLAEYECRNFCIQIYDRSMEIWECRYFCIHTWPQKVVECECR